MNKNQFTKFDHVLRDSRAISADSKLLFLYLSSYKVCNSTFSQIGYFTGWGKSKIVKNLQALEKANLIQIKKEYKKNNLYIIQPKESWFAAQEEFESEAVKAPAIQTTPKLVEKPTTEEVQLVPEVKELTMEEKMNVLLFGCTQEPETPQQRYQREIREKFCKMGSEELEALRHKDGEAAKQVANKKDTYVQSADDAFALELHVHSNRPEAKQSERDLQKLRFAR